MLKGEVIDITSKDKYNVSFFDDDSIETVRYKVALSLDKHPDRLYILVGIKLPKDYYSQDPRNWEALFERMSYNNEPLQKEIFEQYQLEYRTPTTNVAFKAYDKAEWMSYPEELNALLEPSAEFVEYRIFGVEQQRSYVLPVSDVSNTVVSKIPSARLPIPENSKLFNSFYNPKEFLRFLVKQYDQTAESNSGVYYPLLTATTPPVVSLESVRLLQKNSKLLDELLQLEAPKSEEISIIRTRFYVPWVDTDFGSAIRTRFEQIFYGMTVSKELPCITLFTSKDQISRHKFYTEDSKSKKPYLDMSLWNSWWSVKPSRNIPSLILFRGTTKHNFDRITITANDLVVSTNRPEGNKETIDQLERQVLDWLSTFDAVLPFINKKDIVKSRWELQDMSYIAKYSKKIEEFDLLRFNCISNIFDISDKTKSQFSLLRTDHSNSGLSSVQLKILQMMREGPAKPDVVSEELSIPIENARQLIQQVQNTVTENPSIAERAFRGYPTLRLGPDYVIVSSVSNLEKTLQYSDILRFVLSNSESEELNKLCPKRVERVAAESAVISTQALQVDALVSEEQAKDEDDIFGFLDEAEPEMDTESVVEEVKPKNISTEQKQGTTYNYFKSRLQKFDPITFDPVGSQYPKKCEQKHQPIILDDNDLKRIKGTPYDVKDGNTPENKLIDIEEPNGTIVCPEYWCMRDQIPLSDGQLEKGNGKIRCPVCHGELQTSTSDNPRNFPLIKRETGFVFPGYTKYKSPKNNKLMPCCFKTSQASKTDKKKDDPYYVLGETKSVKVNRLALIPINILRSLHINEDYDFLNGSLRRFSTKGYFRTGLGNSSETLPKFLNLTTKIPAPHESVETVLRCSFLSSWRTPGTKHIESIENSLGEKDSLVKKELAKLISGIDEAFTKKTLSSLEELEYSALALQCDIFRIYTESASLGCMFYAPMVRPRSRAIIVMQDESEIDILAYTERKTRGFDFYANIYEKPFLKETTVALEKLRNESCKLKIPSYNDAVSAMKEILPLVSADDYEIILDPYQRGQALYIPSKMILPFQSTPLPDLLQTKISGYNEINNEKLPEYSSMKELLKTASRYSSGFAYKEDLYNNSNQKVEILLESGLRIPVKPTESVQQSENNEVIETVRSIGESTLTFGEESQELKKEAKEISYAAEVYEFLLFQLTKDIEIDYIDLKNALRQVTPSMKDVKPLLEDWFTKTVKFVNAKEPKQFLSKIREPCDEKCDGELCGWDGDVCKVQINSSLKNDKLFHRILTTLLDNSKIRSMVLDGRTTPFFSTILYLELPHELIVSDYELPS